MPAIEFQKYFGQTVTITKTATGITNELRSTDTINWCRWNITKFEGKVHNVEAKYITLIILTGNAGLLANQTASCLEEIMILGLKITISCDNIL